MKGKGIALRLIIVVANVATIAVRDVNARTTRSDSLFNEGMRLYRSAKYSEAIPLFEQVDSIDNAELDSSSNRRIYGKMWLASAYFRLGDTIKARSISPEYYNSIPVDRNLTVKSDSLLSLIVDLFKRERYREAIPIVRQVIRLERESAGPKHIFYGNSLSMLLQLHLLTGETAEIYSLEKEWYSILDSTYDEEDLTGIRRKLFGALVYMSHNRYDRALPILERVWPVCERLGMTDNPEVFPEEFRDNETTLREIFASAYGSSAAEASGLPQMLALCEKGIEIIRQNPSPAGMKIADSIREYAMKVCIYRISNSYSYPKSMLAEIMSFCEKYYSKESSEYQLVSLLQDYEQSLGMGKKQVSLMEQIIPLCEKLLGPDNISLIGFLIESDKVLSEVGRFSDGIGQLKWALRICEKELGRDNNTYILLCSEISQTYGYSGDRKNALEWINKAISSYKESENYREYDYLMLVNRKGDVLRVLQDNDGAIEIYQKVLEAAERMTLTNERERSEQAFCIARTELNLAVSYRNNGDLAKALDYGLRARDAYMENSKDVIYVKWTAMETCSAALADLGNYQEALEFIDECLDDIEQKMGKNNIFYAKALNRKALVSYFARLDTASDSIPNPIELGKEAIEILRNSAGENVNTYNEYIANLSLYYETDKNYEKSYELCREAADQIIAYEGIESNGANIQLNNLSVALARLKRYDEALKTGEQTLTLREKLSGRNHREYIRTLGNILAIYDMAESGKHNRRYIDKIREYVPRYAELYNQEIRRRFSALTSKERGRYVSLFRVYVSRLHKFVLKYGNGDLNGSGYDMALACKGILLSSDIGFRTLIGESGDSTVIADYNELCSLRRRISDLQGMDSGLRNENLDSLEMAANARERALVLKSAEFGDYTRNMSIGWRQVREKLADDAVAVEFVKISYRDYPDSVYRVKYIAYVIDSVMQQPALVDLFPEESLDSIRPSSYYTYTALGHLVWDKLVSYVEGKKKVYFAPDGELYNIAIESVPSSVTEGKELYRLSSTRELALSHRSYESRDKNAVLFGGLDYNSAGTGNTSAVPGDSTGNTREIEILAGNTLRDIRAMVKHVPYLPATLTEVATIGNSLRQGGYSTEILTASEGTEDVFKGMSGRGVTLLHLATHGFYSGNVGDRKTVSDISTAGNVGELFEEDLEMQCSGLLLSGAGKILRGELPVKGAEDGVLTASEIAGLDMRGLDMVVMSACQTGLGVVKGEGVFGLQRGFKKAGAKSILMSLWNVDDKATEILMTGFYNNLLQGKSKHEALRLARKKVKEYEVVIHGRKRHPYSNPRYWAAFILLDAID